MVIDFHFVISGEDDSTSMTSTATSTAESDASFIPPTGRVGTYGPRTYHHSLSQQAIWVSFGHPGPHKSLFWTPYFFVRNFQKCQFQAYN